MTALAPAPLPGDDARGFTRAVFAAGDYAGAAMYGDPATFEHHAARALLRGDEASFAALADFDTPDARFHAAAARWIHGDTVRARRELEGNQLPHAQCLARLIARDRIHVLAQLPWLPGAMTDLGGGASADRQLVLRTIGHRTGDVQNRPYLDVRRCVDDGFAPDFFVAAMVEWHHVPPDLQALACPLFGHVADHDLHVQTIRPWVELFDELCVTDRTEWLDVQGLGRGTVSSFPKVFGLPAGLPPLAGGERHLDFFVSGTMVDPYHPDKARVLHELLAMPDIALRVVRGFTGPLAFHALLAASKASFTFVRRPGAMPTRGLESLALGCAVALQRESVLNLWVGAHEGAATYGPQRGELAAAVRTILDHWDHFGPAARRGAALVRSHFALPRVASQYLRFLTFRAAAPRARREHVDTRQWCQKRLCVTRTWLPEDPAVRRRSMQANFRRLGELAAQRPCARTLVDMARELLCEFVFYGQRGQADGDERALHADAVRLLETCCRLFPRHLAARFLLVRTLWHHGDAAARMRALQLAHDALEADVGGWQIGPDDDVMPFDFHADTFDYRGYLDLVAAAAKGAVVPPAAFARLVLAALAGYVARKTGKTSLHALAASLAPGFARYRLDHAKCLLRRGGVAGRAQGIALLQQLADGSAEFAAAAAELRRAGVALPEPTARALRRMDEDTIDANVTVASLFAVERRAANAARLVRAVAPGDTGGARVAVAVPFPGDLRGLTELLADLDAQTIAGELEVLVAVAAGERSAAGCGRHRAVVVPAAASWAERLAACVAAATAPFVTVAMPGDRLRPDALDVLARALDERPDAALAFGSDGFTDVVPARFDPSACVSFRVAPPFARRRLLATDGIGLHPLWRRALHDVHGPFDPAFGAACEHEFWLRAAAGGAVVQLPLLLVTSSLHAPCAVARDAGRERDAIDRARRAHARGAPLPPFVPQRPLPATLCAPGIREEATSHARLGVIGDGERRDLSSLEQFLGTALLHGDLATAACLLRAAIAAAPHLLAPRLALADLLAAIGCSPRDVLIEAGTCAPYAGVLARRLAALPAGGTAAAHDELPRPEPQPERCPS